MSFPIQLLLTAVVIIDFNITVITNHVTDVVAQHDQQALQEKFCSLKRELEEERSQAERARREALARIEQDRASINTLRDELARVKARMEESRCCFRLVFLPVAFLSQNITPFKRENAPNPWY